MFKIKSKLPFVGALLTAVALMGGAAMYVSPHLPTAQVEQPVTIYGGQTVWGEDVEVVEPDTATIIVKSQETGVVGELIRFDVSESVAESFKWLLVPESVDFEVYDEGKRAVFSARKAGEYMFVVACAYKGTVDVTTHVVTIGGGGPVGPDPPDPGTYPVLPDPGVDASLKAKLSYWCSQAKRPTNEAAQLAGSFDSVAAMVAAGVYTTPQEIIEATGTANKEALGERLKAWVPVLRKLQDEFQQMAQDGELVTMDQHAETWREVAAALRYYTSLLAVD